MFNVRIATFQWLAGGFAGTLGALMLVAPHNFANPVYAPFQPYLPLVGMGFLVSGLGLPVALVFAGDRRWLVFSAHIVLAVAIASLGGLVIAGGAWSGAPSSVFIAVGLLFAARVSLGHSSGQRGPDLLGMVVAATATGLGCMLLLAPRQFAAPVYALLLPHATLVGAGLLVGGIATAAAQSGLHHVGAFVWAAHLLLAAAYFAVLGLVAIPFAAWTAIPYYGGFGVAIALLPAVGRYVDRLDPHSLQVRLSVAFALASALPIIIAVTGVTTQRQFVEDRTTSPSQTANLSSRVRENLSQDQAFEVLISCIALATVAGVLGAKTLTAPLRRLAFAVEKLPDATQSVALPPTSLTEMSDLVTAFNATRNQLNSSQQSLKDANRELEKASRQKSEFLANMSHELRTPLNGIIGFAELMHDGKVGHVSEEHSEYLGYILSSGEHLLRLINDILDLSKVEAGKMDFRPEPVQVSELVGQVVESLRAMVDGKQINVEVAVDPALSAVVIDPGKLKQVLYNYLSNALKFTPEAGQVMIRTFVEGEEYFRVEVEDTGIGISPEDLQLLFSEFQQLEGGADKRYQGTGLGLALTKRIVEAQGGRVGVTSAPGKGSVFFAVLPRTSQPALARLGRPALPARAGAPAVLVIEDDARDREWLEVALSEAGYEVQAVSSGGDAVTACAQRRFDAVTLDLLLPDMHGWEVLRGIRGGALNSDVPVVVVTVLSDKGLAAGFAIQDFLLKPATADELLASLKRLGVAPGQAQGVLVVDDDPTALRLMDATLRQLGYKAVCVTDAEAGLRSAAKRPPAAVVLDLLMPEMDGFQFLEQFRRTSAGRRTPVVVWTGKDLSREERDLLHLSAQGVVLKGRGGTAPLIDVLRGYLSGNGKQQVSASHPGPRVLDPRS